MNLFQLGSFKLHSGQQSDWKIECDSLTIEDWQALARMAVEILPPFRKVYGVPQGGLPFAACLEMYAKGSQSDPILIAEDVITTGNSIIDFVNKQRLPKNEVIGICVFARGKCPYWVVPLFKMSEIKNVT